MMKKGKSSFHRIIIEKLQEIRMSNKSWGHRKGIRERAVEKEERPVE